MRYPDDVDATAFYALALLGTAHDGPRLRDLHASGGAARAGRSPSHPNHPGVAHYLIHSYDDPVHAPLGLRAARRYFAMAPAAPHALHMTSHIYLAAGMWDEVVAANEQATRVGGRPHEERGPYARQLRPLEHVADVRLPAAGPSREAAWLCSTPAACRQPAPEAWPCARPSRIRSIPTTSQPASYIQMWSRYVIDTEALEQRRSRRRSAARRFRRRRRSRARSCARSRRPHVRMTTR